jgi:hypothetical protein
MWNLRSRFPVSAHRTADGDFESTGIGYDDLRAMQTDDTPYRRIKKWIPPFAMNTAQLQYVLRVRGWTMAYGGTRQFNPAIPYALLDAAATARVLRPIKIVKDDPDEKQKRMHEAHVAAVRRAGTYLSLQAAIAYRAWREEQNSIEIAESLGITPVTVRASLDRMKNIARSLGYDVGENHPSYRGSVRLRGTMLKLTKEKYESFDGYIS